jgi:hypothetical protein
MYPATLRQNRYSRGGSGSSAFRVSTNFDSPSCGVRTASNPIPGDTQFRRSTDKLLMPTILTRGSFAPQKRQLRQSILQRCGQVEEYQVTSRLQPFVERGHAIVYRVAHLVGGCSFDELPNSTAHGGTVVNNKESGPTRAGHRGREKIPRFVAKKQYEYVYFSALSVLNAS